LTGLTELAIQEINKVDKTTNNNYAYYTLIRKWIQVPFPRMSDF